MYFFGHVHKCMREPAQKRKLSFWGLGWRQKYMHVYVYDIYIPHYVRYIYMYVYTWGGEGVCLQKSGRTRERVRERESERQSEGVMESEIDR